MPIRRLFGLLVCALSLSSAPVLAQTVSFVDGNGDDASVYLEKTEARVRVTDSDPAPLNVDTVLVTLTAALSGDSEVVSLRETNRDSGVFEGRIRLDNNPSPSQAGVLEAGTLAGPPTVHDTLTAQYGSATDIAGLEPASIQLLDGHGRPATGFTDGDWIHVRVEDHVRPDDPGTRDVVSVLVENPDMGDSEVLPLTETALRTGVFEGRIRYSLIYSPASDGIVGGYPDQQVSAEYDVPGYAEDVAVSVPLAGSRIEILGGDGRPTSLVPESSPLRLRVTHRWWSINSTVETVGVVAHSQLTGDQEPVILTETGPATGVFEGTVPMAVFGSVQTSDGVLHTAEDLGPPHRFDEVSVSYRDDYNYSGTYWASAATYGSETRFTDAEGKDVEIYAAGFPAWVRVEDHNANQPAVVDTIQATVESLTHGDSEVLVLTETGQDTGVFSGSVAVDLPSGGWPGDGRLEAQEDETIRALHGDALGMTASGDLARIRSTRLQFIDADGRAVTAVVENGTARVRLEQSSCNVTSYWADYCPVTFTSRIHADEEELWTEETGEDTGVFVGEIPIPFWYVAGPYNGVLELGNSGSPEYLADEVTARAGPNFASVPAVGFTLRFIHANGEDAETFSPGEAVWLRLEDHGMNDPWEQQTESLLVRVFGSSEIEPVQLTETGADTGVYMGSLPSRFSASPAYDGTLDVEIGSRLLVDWTHLYDSREARDEAVVSGTAPTPPVEESPVTFRDAYGNPADSYTQGTTAYVRVEDSEANLLPTHYDFVQVTLLSPTSSDSATVYLRETTRDSGIFEGSAALDASGSIWNPGLYCVPGEEIEAVYGDSPDQASDRAVIRFSSATFIDEAGEPTGEVLENGVAHLRVVGSSPGPSVNVTVTSSRAQDQLSVTLTETSPGSKVYEGAVQLSFAPPGGGMGNGLLETSNSGSPDYLGDELTVTYQDGEGTAVTIPSRVRFFDSYGRVVSTFAVGERVGVRVEDHNLDDPQYKEQIQVLVHEVEAGDASSVTLIETGFDTNVYEGSIATEDAPVIGGDGTLQLTPGQVIQADRLNENTPHPTVAQATMAGATVVFVDAEGRPAEAYFERTRAYVRVTDAFADQSSSADTITVTLQTFLGLDSESLILTETGPSTGVFEVSIPLLRGGSSNQNNGYLETGQYAGPPHEYDTLTATYVSAFGTVSGTAGMIGSRTRFIDAHGNETDSYVAGTTAYVRVEDHGAGTMPGSYDFAQVTLIAPMTGDNETVYLRETTRESGIFEGAFSLEKEDYPPTPSPNDGRLQSMPGEEIEVAYEEQGGDGESSDTAVIRYSSAEFIDEAGVPTGEVLENGVARLRVTSASTGSSVNVMVNSSRAQDQLSVTLTETFSGSKVYEGAVQLSFVPPGGGMGNGLLETSTSGSPDYLGDELTVTYEDGVGHAVTIPSRIRFFDSIGGVSRVTSTFAVGERVGVRVEDHNLDDPQYKEQIQVLVHEVGSGDADSVTLIETGFDTNIYEGSIATEDAPQVGGDGKLQVSPGRVIQAERLNQHTPYPTVAQATMSGASVVFIDAEGQPAEVYFEGTRAYVRVSDTFADLSPSADQITVTVQTFLGLDSESVSLTETGLSTGVFEGSIALAWGGGSTNPNNGILETGEYAGPPHEYDTLTAAYQSAYGMVSGTVGIIGSRTWFLDAYGNETDSYTAGTTAYVRVEAHVAGSMPGYYDYAQVTLNAPMTGDSETLYLRETTRESGIFEGPVSLEKEDYPPSPSPNDGRLQSMPGEEIEVVYDEQPGGDESSDTAVIRYSSAEFIDETGVPTGEVLENGVARLRVTSASTGSSVNVTVTSSRAQDQLSVTLPETFSGSKVYEGTAQLSFSPPGGGMGNSLLETSTSGSPDYLGDELTVTYEDGVGHAVTIPSRVRFFDSYGRVTTTFAVGERVGVRVEDHNLDDPQYKEQIQVLVREAGTGGDADSVTLIETGFDTNIYKGSIATEDAPPVGGDGKLQVLLGQVIQAERLNQHTPYPTVAQATISGASVVFIDAEGQPAEVYFERTRAYVRVSDIFANSSPSADQITVTVQSFLGLDSESLSLTETGLSTGVFEGSIPLAWGGGSANPNNGMLETGQYAGPPHEYDTLTAAYQSASGPVSGTVGIIGSRTWFLDAYGNETDSYTAGTTAYVRVESHAAGSMPGYYDYAQVTLNAPMTGDSETLYLRETTRDSGVFEGPVRLEKEDYPPSPSPNDGRLQSMPGEEINVVFDEQPGGGESSDTAVIRYSSAEFIDEAGAPTGEVLENGVARLRVTSASTGSSVNVTVNSSRAQDQLSVTLTETFSGSKVYEGTVQLSFVPPGGGMGNGLLETSTSGSPDYLGDELTVTYEDGVGHAVTIPSRVRFFDRYGRVTSTFAMGERVGVRVEDHNLDDPQYKEQIQVLVHEVGAGDADSVTLIETGFDTNIYEGSIATEDAPPVGGDGKLQVLPGRVIQAERLNQHTPYPTVAQATMAGASVVLIDAEGQPAELYYERTRAYVRVSDSFANSSPSADAITATVQSFLGLDSESLSLTETGPSTGVFEGSIPLGLSPGNPNNGFLETGQYAGPPHEFDVLTASYQSAIGPVSDTAGTIGSRTWFVDAYGNLADSYTAGTTAYVRVEDHVAGSMPNHYDYTQIALYAPATGDTETLYLRETTRDSGIFEGPVSLEKEDYPPTPSPNDGRLQSMPGEEIEVVHVDYSYSSDKAVIRYSSAEFIDETGAPTSEVLENGVARLRVTSASTGSSVNVTVNSSRAQDQLSVTLNETFSGSKIYEGMVQLSFVPPGGGMGNGLLETSTSGSPDYLGDELTVTYEDGVGHAVTIPSRVRFFDSIGGVSRVTTTFAVGERVGVRVEDHNLDDPQYKEQIQVLVREVGQGDANSVTLIETGYDTNVYEGSIATEDAPVVGGDGTLQLAPGRVIEAERLNQHTPYPTVARATMSGASVVFIDAQGQPAELYYEGTRAYVRVTDAFADYGTSSGIFTVTLQSFLGLDSENVYLTETGPSTGVFEGSIPLSTSSASPNNGSLETGRFAGPPHEFDTLTASYQSVSGAVSDTVGTIGSRTWFTEDSYAAGSMASFRVEDHTASGTLQVTLRSLTTGDVETATLYEFGGIANGSLYLDRASTAIPGDGKLQSMPGEEIEVEHTDQGGNSSSSDRAVIRYAEAIILEDGQAEYGVVLENGVARIRVIDTSGVGGATVTVQSRYGQDSESVNVTQGILGIHEGTIQLSFVPPGGGTSNNGTLETSNSGSPEYLQDELTVTYLDAGGQAVTVPSRITFHAFAENWPVTEYAVGSDIRVRVQDQNANDPAQVDTTWVTLNSQGDSEPLTLTETGADTGFFEGLLPSSGSPGAPQDGTLTAGPGTVATVEHLNVHTPHPTTAQFSFNGNFAPQAMDDTAETVEEQPVTIDVLANDSDPDQEALTFGWYTQGANGAVTTDAGMIVYTPAAGFVGTDTFTYIASDPRGGESRGTATVTVLEGNAPPVAVDDVGFLAEDGGFTIIDVLANDSDADGDPLEVALLTQPPSGTATVEPDKTVTYTPDPNFNGIDVFTYEITDPSGETASATIGVSVMPVNDPPAANDDAATAAEDGSATVTVLANDTDVENDTLDVTAVTQGTNGAVVLNANDTVTYTPNANFSGTDSFTYTVSDGNSGTGTAAVAVTVTPANDPPVAVDDSATKDEDTAVTVAVLANDTDPDNDTLDVYLVTAPLNGIPVLNADDTVTFTPTAGFHGTASFYYEMRDGNGGTDLGTVTITVNPVNDLPVANDDIAAAEEDSSVNVMVLANDTDPENDTIEVTAVTQGANGSTVINPDNTVTYTPAANFHGTDVFTYTASDGNGGTDTATVNVTVYEANDTPVANDDTATVAEDSPVTVNVLGNDSDADNDTLNVTAVTQGTNGTVTLDLVTYTPNANFHGTDSFTYTISDGTGGVGGTDTATVTVTVTPVNDAPAANDDTASVVEDDSVTVNVLGNDTDADNDTLTVTAVTQGANGAVTLNPVTYTPSPNFFGTDSFTYTIGDGNGGADTATVTVTIAPSNDNLTAVDDSATVAEDGSVTVAVLGNDSDPENDVLSVQSVTQGTNGSVAIVGSQVAYTPNADFHGADSFTYTASDGNGGTDSATVTITVTPVNDAPVAGDDTASVVEDGSVAVTVLGNDADVDEDLLSVTSVAQGANGSVVVNPDDTVTYTPEADFNGTDSFTYTVSDGESDDTATVTVTVGAANDAPVANGDSASTSEDNPVTVTILGNDSDPENDTLNVSAVTQGANGAVVINANDTVTYTPGADFYGADSFTYTASDGNGGTDTATVTVTISAVNDAPVANDDPASVAEDGAVTVTVLANDTDVDNDTLTVTAVTQGAHGTVTLNPVTYTPAANYNGADSFTYTVIDGNGGTDTGTVNVTVGSANDAPVANDDIATVAEDGSVSIPVLANDTDLDNDTLSATSVTQGANGTVTFNPVTYTPNANYNGADSFTYTISDGNGGTDTAKVTVTVTAVNDAPVAVNDSATTLAETPVTILVRTNDTDVDSATLTITAVTQGAHGSVAINGGLTVTYTPATAWIGPDSFTYTISDGAGGTATATVNVTVQAPPRVSTNIQVLYAFDEGSGTTVNDVSGVGTPLNLTVANASAITWLPGALSIDSSTLVQSAGTATKVINASKASNEVTVEAWVLPANLSQTGPAAIVTISQNQTKRDVTLGQSGTAYNGQLRTSTTGQGGTQLNASGVASLTLSHVVYTRSSTGAVRIYVNGTQVATGTLTGNFSTWSNYELALGGELSGTRYWTGDLHLVAIYSRALTSTEVRQNWLAGAN